MKDAEPQHGIRGQVLNLLFRGSHHNRQIIHGILLRTNTCSLWQSLTVSVAIACSVTLRLYCIFPTIACTITAPGGLEVVPLRAMTVQSIWSDAPADWAVEEESSNLQVAGTEYFLGRPRGDLVETRCAQETELHKKAGILPPEGWEVPRTVSWANT